MKQISVFLSIVIIGFFAQAGQDIHPKYFELNPPKVELIEIEELNSVELREFENACLSGSEDDLREFDLDQLVNLGEKLWQIVKDGEPELNFKSKSASAVPAQSECLFNLSSWQIPRSLTYKVSYKNGFGMEVISLKYKLIYTAGGQFNGRGQYLANVSIHPAQIYVGWGFKFDANVHVQNILNIGSSESPEAGMQIALEWSVGSVVNKHKSEEVYFVHGSGEMTQL